METFGWDVISACSQSKINELLKTRMTASSPTLKYSDGGGVDIDIVFDPWQVTDFGSDNKLTLDLPIKSGTLKDSGEFSTKPTVDLAGVIVEITVTLGFVDDAQGKSSSLSFNLKTKASSPSDKTDGAIYVKSADITNKLDSSTKRTLGKRIADALIANASSLSYALSTVNLEPRKSWMKPYKKAHMFGSGPKKANGEPGEGYLVIGTMVRDIKAEPTRDTDPSWFDTHYDFFMLITPDVFLENFVLPDIGMGFEGDPQHNFVSKGDAIHLIVPPVLPPKVDHWGTGYQPVLMNLKISVEDERLRSDASGMFQITGLGSKAYVDFGMTHYSTAHYDSSNDTIGFSAAHSPDPSHNTHIPWYEKLAAVPFLPFVGPIVIAIVEVIINVVANAIVKSVAKSVASGSGTAGLQGLTDITVAWPGSRTTEVKSCGLSDGFYVRGDIS